jgi:hypothetical protein
MVINGQRVVRIESRKVKGGTRLLFWGAGQRGSRFIITQVDDKSFDKGAVLMGDILSRALPTDP